MTLEERRTRLNTLSKDQLIKLLENIHDQLYLSTESGASCLDFDSPWNGSDICEAVTSVFDQILPR
jgi:hypothetical protein